MSGASSFLPRGVRDEAVRDRPRRAARAAHLVFRASDGFEVALPERLLARAIAIGEAHAPLEWLGQLVGTRYRDEQGSHLVLDAIVRDVDARQEPHFVTSTLASEGRTRALAREQYPDAVIVGWIHGHVRHGARYSGHDFENQATWTDPDSVGIVVDPWDPARLAVYRGPKGEQLTQVDDEEGSTSVPRPDPPASRSSDERTTIDRRGRVRRLASRSLLPISAFVVGLWMGRTEARLAATEETLCEVPAVLPAWDESEAPPEEPTVCTSGLRVSEYPEGAQALCCDGVVATQGARDGNGPASTRMEEPGPWAGRSSPASRPRRPSP